MTIQSVAHVKQLDDGSWKTPHLLDAHLAGVAEIAAAFGKVFASSEWCRSLGMGHDTGKERSQWQKYLLKKSGYDLDAHLEGKPGKIDHSSPGAKLAEELFGKGIGRLLAYCIAGHHAGLPDWYPDEAGGQSALKNRLEKAVTGGISEELKNKIRAFKPGSPPWKFDYSTLDMALWLRMLFSTLVDADFLDTERYMDGDKVEKRGGYLSITELLQRFNTHIAEMTAKAPETVVNEIRRSVLADCRSAAHSPSGMFSLTVPTGGGKTLSSLAFALEHAMQNKLDRVIYVIPYTSIIEQNADVFRKALGDEQVVEHHSNLDEDDSTVKSRLAAENWDAPVIVTTSVQFFESLFASKPSRCRKLHNIANSVVVLDEVQLLPVEFQSPILRTLELLSDKKKYRTSFVLSTATQPALESRPEFKTFPGLPTGSVREIISDVPKLYKSLNRVSVEIPTQWQRPSGWDHLAVEIKTQGSILCIVSDRKSCRDLYHLLPSDTYHLSALMCGQHRSNTIAEIKRKMADGEIVRVVSTQLVEAGVDLDFPVVYRAMAGLDSIAQAAGRCNREGKLDQGRVVVFVPPKKSPPGILRKAAEITETMLKTGINDPLDHSVFKQFFSELYWKANSLDTKGIIALLKPDPTECGIQFRTAAQKFHMIDDKQQRTILVPYGDGESLIAKLKLLGPERWLLRKLQRFSVNVYTGDFAKLIAGGKIYEICTGTFALVSTMDYNDKTGLNVDENPYDPELLIL